jgi:predicted MPP superfamily phosphohydrolase
MLSWIILITVYAVALNWGYASLQVYLLKTHQMRARWLIVAIYLWALLMSVLFVLQMFASMELKTFMRHWLYLPLAVHMVWNLLFIQILLLGTILATLIVRWRRRVKPSPPMTTESGISRRQFLYLASYGAAPTLALGMGVHGTLTRHDLRVRHLNIPIAGLPPELEGFTIAHVSDLHSGIFCGPGRLKIIRDATNDLKADLVAVTGDIINNEMGEFTAAIEAIKRMESRYGTQLCEGNHDRIPGPGLVLDACAENNLPMLFNSCAILPVRGRRLLIGGVPWMRQGFEGHPEMVSNLYPARQEGDVRILLAHHPHMFDIADSADLVLTGHTHGGQIMIGPVGFGPLIYKYWSGLYRRGNTAMVVSNGCGDWFPCRIGAPAEIGLLRLTGAS